MELYGRDVYPVIQHSIVYLMSFTHY